MVASCSNLQTKLFKTANKGFSKPHYLQIESVPNPHYLQINPDYLQRNHNKSFETRLSATRLEV